LLDPDRMPRRVFLRAAIAGTTAVLALCPARRADAQEKLSKQDAAYQDTPKDDHACGTCTLFQPPQSCKVVEGEISDHGWCKLFEESPE
jgi:hypothetical protein